MPAFPPRYLDAATFLYNSRSGALNDAGFLAVGFFVRIPSEAIPGAGYNYLVTNEHVVRGQGKRYARLHLNPNPGAPMSVLGGRPKAGGFKVIEFKEKDFAVNRQRDLAITPYSVSNEVLFSYIPTEYLIRDYRSGNDRFAMSILPGDDLFMVSRIVRREVRYKKENLNVLRFGNVALCPKYEEPLFIAEMRSIAGHSGSPVFVYDTPFNWGELTPRKIGIRLLGINRGHLRDFEQIVTFDDRGKTVAHKRWFTETNMAMSHIVPAWEIMALLNSEKVRKQRERSDAKLRTGADFKPDSMPLTSQTSEQVK